MNTQTVHGKLGHFRSFSGHGANVMIFQSRANLNRIVKVVDIAGSCKAFTINLDDEGKELNASEPAAIESLVEFLEGK